MRVGVTEYYSLSYLERVEVEFLSSQQMADKQGRGSVKKWSTTDTNVLVHYVSGNGVYNLQFKGYTHWVTILSLKDFRQGFVRKTWLTTIAVKIIKWAMR